jgi:hypothetical protein
MRCDNRCFGRHTGKKPASKIPRTIRSGISWCHDVTKPKQIIVAPQRIVIVGRKTRGPSFRSTTVAGGWRRTYEMKNIRTMIEYRSPMSFKSTPMPATTAIPWCMSATDIPLLVTIDLRCWCGPSKRHSTCRLVSRPGVCRLFG